MASPFPSIGIVAICALKSSSATALCLLSFGKNSFPLISIGISILPNELNQRNVLAWAEKLIFLLSLSLILNLFKNTAIVSAGNLAASIILSNVKLILFFLRLAVLTFPLKSILRSFIRPDIVSCWSVNTIKGRPVKLILLRMILGIPLLFFSTFVVSLAILKIFQLAAVES